MQNEQSEVRKNSIGLRRVIETRRAEQNRRQSSYTDEMELDLILDELDELLKSEGGMLTP